MDVESRGQLHFFFISFVISFISFSLILFFCLISLASVFEIDF